MKVKYPCSYCGGFETDVEDPPNAILAYDQTNIAIKLSAEAISDRPAFSLEVCIWCWKKSIDAVLGPPKEK